MENRTARRRRRVGSESATPSMTAWAQMAMVHMPWRMIPGSPTLRAKSSSTWMVFLSPEASAYRSVWSASRTAVTSATGSARPPLGKPWSGRSAPLLAAAFQPRTNMVPNCSITSSPVSTSWLVERIVTQVPARAAWTPYRPASVDSVVPGTSGRWNRMSWRAWSSIGICSAGMTSWRAAIIGSQDGITENTGGASRPEAYAGLVSLVAST